MTLVSLCFEALFYLLLVVSSVMAEEDRVNGGYRLELSDGPFKQYSTIGFRIEGTPNHPNDEYENLTGTDVSIVAPSGSQLLIPTFQTSTTDKGANLECRFTPRETGTYTATIREAGAGSPGSHSVTFDVVSSPDERGFLHVDRKQPYFLQFDNGDQFRGIGTNIGWEPHRRPNQKYSYDALFPRIASHGLNTVRTWTCPWNMPIGWNGERLGEYEEASLKRLNEMFALAEKSGLYVVLVLGYHGELQTVSGAFPNNDRWKENPYNVANGGPCETPADFFTNAQAKALYKKRLRMLVARVAGQPHLLAWEFWNEIDHIERRGPVPGAAIVAWHNEMAEYLRSIDGYDHPITTSVSVKAPDGMWEIANLDLIMLHPYGVTDKLTNLLTETNARYDKPAIAGEFSYSWKPAERHEEADFDRELRLGLWRGLMSPTPVLPMTWWWEYHDSRGDWRYFQPVEKFSRRMTDLHASNWIPLRVKSNDDSIECYGIVVGESIFLWLRNGSESTAAGISLALVGVETDDYVIKQFDMLTGTLINDQGILLRADGKGATLSIPSLPGHTDTSFMLSR